MTTIFNNIKLTEIENHGCSDAEVRFLTNVFTNTVAQIAPTLARETWFKLEDFANSEDHGVDNFMLMIVRKSIRNQDQWRGIFQGDKKRLKIVTISEKGYSVT